MSDLNKASVFVVEHPSAFDGHHLFSDSTRALHAHHKLLYLKKPAPATCSFTKVFVLRACYSPYLENRTMMSGRLRFVLDVEVVSEDCQIELPRICNQFDEVDV